MYRVSLEVSLTLRGPVLSQSTGPGSWGIDAVMARRDGLPALPYSLVRGKLREAWNGLGEIAGDFDIDDLLGPEVPVGGASALIPQRGRLFFRDFTAAVTDPRPSEISVRRDPERKAADPRHLRVIEALFAPGSENEFCGRIEYFAHTRDESARIARDVERGLRWVPSFGAERTSGYGRNLEVQVTADEVAFDPGTYAATGDPRFELTLQPRDPFCVTGKRRADNLFQTEDRISGGALRGVLATTLNRLCGRDRNAEIANLPEPWRELGAAFHDLRFSHALPAPAACDRPQVPPLSLVAYEGNLLDAAGLGPDAFSADLPSFQVDWKGLAWSAGNRHFGWGDTRGDRRLVVRTSIDPTSRRAASEELFAYEMIYPNYQVVWKATLDLGAVDESIRNEVELQVRAVLAGGLIGIGKTKAGFDVASLTASEPDLPEDSGPWVVTLQSSTLLCDPREIQRTSLGAAYDKAFRELSDGAITLDSGAEGSFFARQELYGGYLAQRYPLGSGYEPYFSTEAGSTFVLSANPGREAEAAACIRRWAARGLPLPAWAEPGKPRWRHGPFLPENGFGEIRVRPFPTRDEERHVCKI